MIISNISYTGSSKVNGDIIYVSEDKKLFLLADGASGAGKDGKVLMGKICVETAKEFDYSSSNMSAKEYVNELLWKINEKLIRVSQQYKKSVYGTLDIAVFDNNMLTITSIGDSPMIIKSKNEIKRVAVCKKQYENLIDQGFITREEYQGYINNMHCMMRSCFERFVPMIIPNNIVEEYTISKGDIFVMCCDGLSDWLNADEIISYIDNTNSNSINKVLENLVEKAKEMSLQENNYYDDISILTIIW